ncbi:MAG: Txe/YoeB family addiction module toxin [Pseudomonadota bacterium]|nr:Txe/YoeB family addiction module toxin [Pseudomonadota bacterium]
MEIVLTSQAQEDQDYWKQVNPKILSRIEDLIKDIQAHPFTGIGKPEPLKFDKRGYWSRRINREHRLVYKVHEKTLYIAQCRYHYD